MGGYSSPAWEGTKAFLGSIWHNTLGAPIDDGTQVWANTAGQDMNVIQRTYVSVGTGVASFVGVRQISDAFSKHDAIDAHVQSATERVFKGVSGGVQLATTALPVAKPLGGALGVAKRSATKAAGHALETGAASRTAITAAEEAEVLAQRALTEMQGQIQNGHFLTRHSPMMTLQELLQRATVGIPNKAGKLVKNDASRFFNYVDMKQAAGKAIAAHKAAGPNAPERIVIDMMRPIGEGFLKGGGALQTTTRVEAGFNKYGQLITIFPKLK